jgi:hypothetical protein
MTLKLSRREWTILTLGLVLSVVFSPAALAGVEGAATVAKNDRRKNLSTDIRFSDKDVQGKYQIPAEAVAAVEDEKSMISLIEPRREFKDRLRKSVTQR